MEYPYKEPTIAKQIIPPPPTAQSVYSAENIGQAVMSPVAPPNTSDPIGLYDYYLNSGKIQEARGQVQELQNQINASAQALRATTSALEGQNERAMGGTGASVNLIGKQVGRARQLTSDELSALGENRLAAVSYLDTLIGDARTKYEISLNERNKIQDLIRQTGGQAKISYTDSFESAQKKAQKYLDSQAEEKKKTAYKEALKEELQKLGLKTKGSTNELEKRLSKEIRSKKDREKFFEDLKIRSTEADILNTYSLISERGKEKPEKEETLDLTNKGLSNMIDEEINSGTSWNDIAKKLYAAGIGIGEGSSADKYLRHRFLGEDNPFKSE